MTQDVALFHRGHDAIEQMQVRAADGAGGDLDDGVAPVLDLGIRYRVTPNVVLAVPGQRSHSKISMPQSVPGQTLERKSVPQVRGTTMESRG